MKIKTVAFVATLFFCTTGILAQKLKYKDLFPILDAKNYDEGGPLLVQYLAGLKKDEANPNLQMGFMLEHRFFNYDIVDDSSKIYSSGDSAILFLEKARTLIDEKELRKNDEYYLSFFRRDLRTGEFGIKVSDVHLDIEKKVEVINNYSSNVQALNKSILRLESLQSEALEKFRGVVANYSDYNELLLAINEDEKTALTEIQSIGSDAVAESKNIKELAKQLESDKYQSEIDLKEIQVFGKDGLTSFDQKSGSIALWDYETWSRETLSEIRGGVGLFKTMISNYVDELRKKKAKLKKSEDVDGLVIPKDLLETFGKYESESTVKKLLKVETFESRVIKLVDLQINRDLLDSSKIGSQLKIYSEAKANVDSMYSMVSDITTEGLADAKKKYPQYIKSFFSSYGTASKYVEDMKKWSARNKEWLTNSVEYWTNANKWGIIAKEGEPEVNVPLFMTDSIYNDFEILRINKFTIPQVILYGINHETKKGYLGSFGEDRVEQWSIEFELPNSDTLFFVTDTIPSSKSATSFYIYNENSTESNLSAVSYTDSGTQEWVVNVTVSKKPVDFKFDELTQELTILLYPEEQLPLDSDELGYLVIDRNGNIR